MEDPLNIFLFFLAVIAFLIFLANRKSPEDQPAPRQPVRQPTRPSAPTPTLSRSFELQLRDASKTTDEGETFSAHEVFGRGPFGTDRPRKLGISVSVFDLTHKGHIPVFCPIEQFQEDQTPAYQTRTAIGREIIGPAAGFGDWCLLAPILTEVLHPPYSGRRELKIVVRLVDIGQPPRIKLGRVDPQDKHQVIWTKELTLRHHFPIGYLEREENQSDVATLTVKIAMGVAMSDGHFHEEEGERLKAWIQRTLEAHTGEAREGLKTACNNAMRESYAAAKKNELDFHQLITELKDVGETTDRYAALELCSDIMAADGIADIEELKLLKQIERELGLDAEKVEEIRDCRVLELKDLHIDPSNDAATDYLLGIDPEWDAEKIKKHLRKKFSKWNSRITVLPAGPKRDNAQRMLDLIGKVRQKHVG